MACPQRRRYRFLGRSSGASRGAAHAQRDGDGAWWSTYNEVLNGNAGSPAAFTGYFYGAAGFGLLMLQMDALQQDALRPTP